MREGANPRTLIEVRRFLSRPFDVQFAPPDKFDRILSERYAMDGQAAADAAGSLGLGDELSHLATDLPTADDLLDSADDAPAIRLINRSEEHTSELQSLMRISYAVFCLKKKK